MKLLLVDDHALFRDGMAILLASLEPEVTVFEASSCETALELIARCAPIDIVLMDLQLPGMSGIDAIRVLREGHPEIPVVAVSSTEDKDVVLEALDAGAMGYIPKTSTSSVLKAALRLVLSKGIYLPPSVFLSERVSANPPTQLRECFKERGEVTPLTLGLTARQSEVLLRILQGKSAKIIGRELGLSGSTVKVHTSAVLRALNVTTRTQAIVAASKLRLRFPDRVNG